MTPLVAPTVAVGSDRTNAAVVDAWIATLIAKVNELVGIANVVLGDDDSFTEESVDARALSGNAQGMLGYVAELAALWRKNLRSPALTDFADDATSALSKAGSSPPEFYFLSPNGTAQATQWAIPGDAGIEYRLRFRVRSNIERTPYTTFDPGTTPPPNATPTLTPPHTNPSRFATFGWTASTLPTDLHMLHSQIVAKPTVFYGCAGYDFCYSDLKDAAGALIYRIGWNWRNPALPGDPANDHLWPEPVDQIVEFTVRGKGSMSWIYDSLDNGRSYTGDTNYPVDDDPRFPYLFQYRVGPTFQLDLLSMAPVVDDSNQWLVTDFGVPIITSPTNTPIEV